MTGDACNPEQPRQRATAAILLSSRQLDALAAQLAAELAERLDDDALAQRIAGAVVQQLSGCERSKGDAG
jgi:hypothetical protein